MWKLGKTIGVKIAAGYTVLFFFSLMALAITAYLLVGNTLARQDRQMVVGEIESLRSQYENGGWKAFHGTVVDNNRARKNNPFFTRLPVSSSGSDLVFFPHHWDDFDLVALQEMRGQLPGTWLQLPNRSGSCVLEILTASQPDGSLFQVGISTEDRLVVLDRFREALVTIAVPLILLAVAGGAVLSRRVLHPLRNLIGTVASIESGKMDARVPSTQTGDELEELGSLFNRMIEKINQLIRAMRGSLDSVAHDLRTPMTRFRNNAEKALQAETSDAACREALQDCVEESDRILRMLAMLMDISEAETGTMRLLPRPLDLVPLAEGVADMYRYVADEKGVGLVTEFPAEARLNADVDRIRQVLANLLDNAVKFTPEGGTVRLTIERHAQTVIVRVTDSGIGIDPEEIQRIWDRLYRGTRSSHKGLGLGLSLVKAVVNAHNGEMRVSSTPGSGSIFEIHLPTDSLPPAG
ncbi:sensor histidine kinase [Desulfosarcina sp.]|uniref:sensor histidine kinase n=1 Tax=Desulfosarcina sp. TaxID=2027861 RepID=UPI00356A7518